MDSLILCKFLRGVFDDLVRGVRRAAARRSPAAPSTPPSCGDGARGSCDVQEVLQRARGLEAGGRHAARPAARRGHPGRAGERRAPHPRAPGGHAAQLQSGPRLVARGSSEGECVRRRCCWMPDAGPTDATARIALTIDGRAVEVAPGTTIWEAARDRGDRDPRALPRPAPRAGRRLPHVRRRRRASACWRPPACAPASRRHGGEDGDRGGRAAPRRC